MIRALYELQVVRLRQEINSKIVEHFNFCERIIVLVTTAVN